MALLKLPHMAQQLVPFAVLFGGMLAFWRLTRSHELVVARAAGVSVWQFLLPTLGVAALIGIFKIGLLGPLAAVTLERFERFENVHFLNRPSRLSLSRSGLWLREQRRDGRLLVHARHISGGERSLSEVIIFRFKGDDQFKDRIDAASAVLADGYWVLRDVWLTGPDRRPEQLSEYRLETALTWRRIDDSLATPETLSFWELPRFIEVLEESGFPALRHRLYFHAMLASPLLLCAMVLISATFSLRPSRRSGTGILVAGGISVGFLLYVLSDVVFALGLSGRIPVELAAWTPAGVSTLLGVATLLHLEDG
jgi:lipopolysaccharide export system permease protein